MRRILAVLTALVLTVGFGALSAQAADVPVPTPTPTVVPSTAAVTVAWEMPSWTDNTHPTWPQVLVTSIKTEVPNLAALDAQLTALVKCGVTRQFQVDAYNDNQITTDLIAGGTLTSPHHPEESFPSPSGWDVTYKLVQIIGPVCPVVVPPVTPPTHTLAYTGVATIGFAPLAAALIGGGSIFLILRRKYQKN